MKEDKINCLLHVDAISSISVEKGYNNYWDNLLDGKDEDIVTTLDANWENKIVVQMVWFCPNQWD